VRSGQVRSGLSVLALHVRRGKEEGEQYSAVKENSVDSPQR
jgi:hypothetical protein